MPIPLAARLAVYLVADPELVATDFVATIEAALAGGVTAVQLRAKRLTDRDTLALARRLRTLCRDADALFLVNDRLDLALAAGADGVHLGVDDLPLADARRLSGPDFVIGYSPETDAQTASAASSGADYLGVGPVYGTTSKHDAGAAIGLGAIAHRSALAGIPLIGIGGINATNAAPVIEAGAGGVAVASAVLKAPNVKEATTRLAAVVGAARKRSPEPSATRA